MPAGGGIIRENSVKIFFASGEINPVAKKVTSLFSFADFDPSPYLSPYLSPSLELALGCFSSGQERRQANRFLMGPMRRADRILRRNGRRTGPPTLRPGTSPNPPHRGRGSCRDKVHRQVAAVDG